MSALALALALTLHRYWLAKSKKEIAVVRG